MDGNTFRLKLIEAEVLGMKALGKQYNFYSQAAPLRSGRYKGQIVAENEVFVVQQTSPVQTVRHIKDRLSEVPDLGQNVTIGYSSKHLGRVTPR